MSELVGCGDGFEQVVGEGPDVGAGVAFTENSGGGH